MRHGGRLGGHRRIRRLRCSLRHPAGLRPRVANAATARGSPPPPGSRAFATPRQRRLIPEDPSKSSAQEFVLIPVSRNAAFTGWSLAFSAFPNNPAHRSVEWRRTIHVCPPKNCTLMPPRQRSEGKAGTDCRSKVVVRLVGDAGAMGNRDGQTAAHPGIRNPGKTVETLGEVMI